MRWTALPLAAVTALALSACSTTETGSAPSSAAATTTTTISVAAGVVTPLPLPKPADFSLEVKVVEKKCFGSAGCLITYRIVPTYTSRRALTEESYTVVYEIAGGEEPQTGRFTAVGAKASGSEGSIQTSNSKAVLTAKVTDIY